MSAQEKTERATPKRLREARKRGEVARSTELMSTAVLAAGLLALWIFGDRIAADAMALMRSSLAFDPAVLDQPAQLPAQFGAALARALASVLPLLLAVLAAVLLAPALIGGWVFAPEAVKLDFSRLNPVQGLGRIFSAHSLIELGKALLKFALLGGIAGGFLWASHAETLRLGLADLHAGLGHGVGLLLACVGWLLGGMLLIAGIDAPYQRLRHNKRLRMTRQEVRDEYKESEGRPEVKARLRQRQQQLATGRMMEAVAGADVVVTNPTHYAVALQYQAGAMRAPKVVAKGAGEIAAAIRERAAAHGVPLLSAPPLARALYRSTPLDQEIPATLYEAVAQVLGYIYRLRDWREGERPAPPEFDAVPGGEPDPEPAGR